MQGRDDARRGRIVAVIGAGECDGETAARAEAVGRALAEHGLVLVTGGLGGVMKAASRGAREAGGLVLGLLPGSDPCQANEHVQLAVATGMGDARNAILANTAEGFVAVGGAHGTLSEIAFALKRAKPVIGRGTWPIEGVEVCEEPVEAVERLLQAIEAT
jgi:uncharacterized protein (TIGR00725 family)